MKYLIPTAIILIIVAYAIGYHHGLDLINHEAAHKKFQHTIDSLNQVIGRADQRIIRDDDILKALNIRLQLDSVRQIEDEKQKQAIHGYYQKILHSYDNASDSVLDGFLRARIDSIRQRDSGQGTH